MFIYKWAWVGMIHILSSLTSIPDTEGVCKFSSWQWTVKSETWIYVRFQMRVCGISGWLSDLRSFCFSTFSLCAQNDLPCPVTVTLNTEGSLTSPPALVLVCGRARSRCLRSRTGCQRFTSWGELKYCSVLPGKKLSQNFLHFPLAARLVC